MTKNINITIRFPFYDLATLALKNLGILNITTDLQNYESNTHYDALLTTPTKFLQLLDEKAP